MAGSVAKMQAARKRLLKLDLGYDQSNRWSFFTRSTKTLHSPAETDCSALCGAIISLGGYDIDLGTTHAGFSTRTFAAEAKKAGFSVLKFKSLSQLRPGDFTITPGRHVEFVYTGYGENAKMYSAVQDEYGRASGGAVGNQTGRETRSTVAYVPSYGWDYIVRPPDTTTPTSTTTSTGGVSEVSTGDLPSELEEDEMTPEQSAMLTAINDRTSTLLARSEKVYDNTKSIPTDVWSTVPSGSERSPLSTIEWTHRTLVAQQAALEALASANGVDPEEVVALVTNAVDASLSDLRITRG